MEKIKYLQVGLLFAVLTGLCLIIFIIISVVANQFYSGSSLFLSAIQIISLILIITSIIGGVLACLLIALYFIKKI
ncbi:MAG: hypothetical protein ACFFCY_05185 [Promethearchaeota archaeon]|jgi:hypothetical protein